MIDFYDIQSKKSIIRFRVFSEIQLYGYRNHDSFHRRGHNTFNVAMTKISALTTNKNPSIRAFY